MGRVFIEAEPWVGVLCLLGSAEFLKGLRRLRRSRKTPVVEVRSLSPMANDWRSQELALPFLVKNDTGNTHVVLAIVLRCEGAGECAGQEES